MPPIEFYTRFFKIEKCRNYTNSKMVREMHQYLSLENESGADRELRFIAVDRRNPHLKRINIGPFHDHVEIRNFHLFSTCKKSHFKNSIGGVFYERNIERMNRRRLTLPILQIFFEFIFCGYKIFERLEQLYV